MMTRFSAILFRFLFVSLLCLVLWPQTSANAAGGIGGTGISALGVVQRFGSIFVNGREYFLTDRTKVLVDGMLSNDQALHLGDVVMVQGGFDPASGRVEARRVESRHGVVGVVTDMEANGRGFRVLGESVRLDASTYLQDERSGQTLRSSDLRIGDVVSVAGLSQPNGAIAATRVGRLYTRNQVPASVPFLLLGTVSAVGGDHIDIDGKRIAAPVPTVKKAQAVMVFGRVSGGRMIAERVQPEERIAARVGDRFEMTGYVQAARPGEVSSNDLKLHYGAATLFAQGTTSGLVPGQSIAIQGVVQADGAIAVEKMAVGIDVMHYGLPAVDLPMPERRGDKQAAPERGEHAQPEREQGGRERPEVHRPEVERPQAERPEIERPNIERPEVERPEIHTPDIMGE